ncbi:MAG: tetratricopeptide repeat protein [Bryobacteraceae bacterium]|nr:tetratricopeptide repeat protein [Bryobacteraceae bacterium]
MWLPVVVLLLPALGETSLREVEKLIAAGRFPQARQALEDVPRGSAHRHLLASKIYDGLNDPGRAVEEAEAALAIDPRQEAYHLQLGQIFLARNTPQAAAEVFEEALRLFPDSLLLRLGNGIALKNLMRYEDAERQLRQCLQRQPGFPLAFDELATVLLLQKRFEDVRGLADQYRAAHPADYRGFYFAAAAREKAGEPAIESLISESIRLNPNFAAAQALLGKVRLESGRAAEAIAPLERALQLRPDYTPAALHLAQAYRRAGRRADADRALQLLRELKDKESRPAPALRYHRGKR